MREGLTWRETETGAHDLEWDGQRLARYRAEPGPGVDAVESPKPCFAELRTLAGDCVTNYRPNDHRWHHGLAMTMCCVSGMNFWGGVTYRREDGYKMRPNIGRQVHTEWIERAASGTEARLVERVDWLVPDGKRWMEDVRRMTVTVDRPGAWWRIDFDIRIVNVSGQTLRLGTYASEEGLPGSHYTRDFFGAPGGDGVFGPDALKGEEALHGTACPWIVLHGSHDDSPNETTLLLADHPGNPGFPNRWFVRRGQPSAAFPFVSTHGMDLEHQAELRLRHTMVIANGTRDATEMAAEFTARQSEESNP